METNTERLTTEELIANEANERKKRKLQRFLAKNLAADRKRARMEAEEHGAKNREVVLEVVYRSEYRKYIAKIRWASDGAIFKWSADVPTEERARRVGLGLIDDYKLNLVETKSLKI